jgi:hypothetical protein
MFPGSTLYWMIAAPLFLCGAFIIFMNYYAWLYLGYARRGHHSPVPFIGGGLCAVALLVSPFAEVRPWAWVPLLLDPGCVYLIGLFIYSAVVTKGFK